MRSVWLLGLQEEQKWRDCAASAKRCCWFWCVVAVGFRKCLFLHGGRGCVVLRRRHVAGGVGIRGRRRRGIHLHRRGGRCSGRCRWIGCTRGIVVVCARRSGGAGSRRRSTGKLFGHLVEGTRQQVGDAPHVKTTTTDQRLVGAVIGEGGHVPAWRERRRERRRERAKSDSVSISDASLEERVRIPSLNSINPRTYHPERMDSTRS